MGNSPKKGILNVATGSSVDKVSLGFGRFVGIVSGVSCNSSPFEDVVNRHNQAQEVVKQCQTRFTELTAIIKDRTQE